MSSLTRTAVRNGARAPNWGKLRARGRALLHVLFRRRTNITHTAIAAELGICINTVRTELNYLELGGYIELDPLRLTFAGIEVVRGYRDA